MVNISGWWYTYPSEKYESQWEGLSHILWKIKFMFQNTNQMMFHFIRHSFAFVKMKMATTSTKNAN